MMIEKEKCIGCEICRDVCPVNAIEMKNDTEGFRYPLVNTEQCIYCKKCERECPIQKTVSDKPIKPIIKLLCGHFKEPKDTLKSSSGGFATAISRYFIKNRGAVFGVAYSDDFKFAEYRCATKIDELECFRGSKYVQTRKQDLYKQIQKCIRRKQKVLVIGLPCDIGAVLSYFEREKNAELIYTCELICHGITSEKILVEYQKSVAKGLDKKIINFEIRHKKDRWAPFFIRTDFEDGKFIEEPYSESTYKKAFFVLLRRSCYHCQYKNINSKADITIGDYWGISESNPAFQREGVSLILVRNEKVLDFLKEIDEFEFFEADEKIAYSCNPSILYPTKEHELREKFSLQLQDNGYVSACDWFENINRTSSNQEKSSRIMEKIRCVLRLIRKRN